MADNFTKLLKNNFFKLYALNWLKSQPIDDNNKYQGNIDDLIIAIQQLQRKARDPQIAPFLNGKDIKELNIINEFQNFVNKPDIRSQQPNGEISVAQLYQYYEPLPNGSSNEELTLAELGRFALTNRNNDFNTFLDAINKKYNPYPIVSQSSKNIILTPKDVNRLSKMEKMVLRSIAKIYGKLVVGQDFTYKDLQILIAEMMRHKTDPEKTYLLALFFPEKVRNVHQISPFPVPTFTFHQHCKYNITPNNLGNFVVQLTCPFLATTALGGTVSNLYVCTDNSLDGTNIVSAATAVANTKVPANTFQNAVLIAAKISVRYVGRSDYESGYFGGCNMLSTKSATVFESNCTNFDFVNRSMNGCIADLNGLNVIYYPPDYSYMSFIQPDYDPIGKSMNTTMRLVLYGSSLQPGTLTNAASVVLSVTTIWNTMPFPSFSDIMNLDYSEEDISMDLLKMGSVIPKGGLGTFKNGEVNKIQDFLNLPPSLQEETLENYKNQEEKGRYPLSEYVPAMEGTEIVIPIEKETTTMPKLINIEGGNIRRKEITNELNEELESGLVEI